MLDGDMTLVSALGQIKLAAEAAIKNAFKSVSLLHLRRPHACCRAPRAPPPRTLSRTRPCRAAAAPEVIAMFAKREPAALRGRLAKLSQESRLGHLSPALFKTQAVEVILALKKLGEQLTAEEAHVLDSASSEVRGQFEADDRAIAEDKIVSMAGSAAGGRR